MQQNGNGILDLMMQLMRTDFDLGLIRDAYRPMFVPPPILTWRQRKIREIRSIMRYPDVSAEELSKLEVKAKILEKRWGEIYRDLDRMPDSRFKTKSLARTHFKLKKFQEAEQCAQKLLDSHADEFWGHYIVGICKATKAVENEDFEELKKAEVHFKKAQELIDRDSPILQKANAIRKKYLIYKKLYWYMKREKELQDVKRKIKEFEDSLDLKNKEHQLALKQFSESLQSQVPKCEPIPGHFICAITQELMIDPVMSDAGTSFEKKAFKEMIHHARGPLTDPVTRQRITTDYVPNRALKEALSQYLAANPYAYRYFEGENYKLVTF